MLRELVEEERFLELELEEDEKDEDDKDTALLQASVCAACRLQFSIIVI